MGRHFFVSKILQIPSICLSLLQAFLCRYKEETNKCSAIHLTTVHNPTIYEERMRIQKAGGHVQCWQTLTLLHLDIPPTMEGR